MTEEIQKPKEFKVDRTIGIPITAVMVSVVGNAVVAPYLPLEVLDKDLDNAWSGIIIGTFAIF
jgi:hypothetical protein